MRKQAREGDEIEFVSAVIRVSEDANILREEIATYAMNNLFSDLGGDLGLFLGLCIWSIVESALHALVALRNKIENFKNSRFWKEKLGITRGHLPTPTPSDEKQNKLSSDLSKNSIFSETEDCSPNNFEKKNDGALYSFTV